MPCGGAQCALYTVTCSSNICTNHHSVAMAEMLVRGVLRPVLWGGGMHGVELHIIRPLILMLHI